VLSLGNQLKIAFSHQLDGKLTTFRIFVPAMRNYTTV
jgi:hypothetical protein